MRFINTILAVAAISTVTIAGPTSCVPNRKCDEEGALTCGRFGRDTAVFKCVSGCWDPQAPFCLGQEHCTVLPTPHCEIRGYRKNDE